MSLAKHKQLVLLGLNELNFDIVRRYLDSKPRVLNGFRQLVSLPGIETSAESEYNLLEPWIQWASVHTGRAFAEHGVYRLGDIVEYEGPQIFEQVEARGFVVGAISPMNACNRLRVPAYFMPDPWTKTEYSGGRLEKKFLSVVSALVKENSTLRLGVSSIVTILLTFVRFAKLRRYPKYVTLALLSLKKPWFRALFLDLLLHDIHLRLFTSQRVNFSTLFLNAGAHIQHHYFFNSSVVNSENAKNPEWYVKDCEDPLFDCLVVYDEIVKDYLELIDVDVITLTGLSQTPYDRVKYYYRLVGHEQFFRHFGFPDMSVTELMSRDFTLQFLNEYDTKVAENLLHSIVEASTGTRIFGDIQNYGDSLFVSLTYPRQIDANTFAVMPDWELSPVPLCEHVRFVAIKNGMHCPTGFGFFKGKVEQFMPKSNAHVKDLYSTIDNYFGSEPNKST